MLGSRLLHTVRNMEDRHGTRLAVGLSAVIFSALYLVSDVIEALQGGFSTGQLWLTMVAETAVPPLVLAFYALQRPRIRRRAVAAAAAYAAVYVFFTWTVVYALVRGTPDFDALTNALAPWMTVGGGVMVIAGSAFAIEVSRARVLPGSIPTAFMLGVVLVAAASGLSEPVQVLAAAVRDLGFAAIGLAIAVPLPGPARPAGPVPMSVAQTVHVRGRRPTPAQLLGEIKDASIAVPLALAAPLVRRWHSRWGATDREVAAAMPGDGVVPGCQVSWTRAISIEASPGAVWPWLVQVGFGRAGFYSNDLLDNVGHPSARGIDPELQTIAVGDWIPMFKKVDATTAFRVQAFEPSRCLVWAKPDSTWVWTLTPRPDGGTRLVTRLRQRYDRGHPAQALASRMLMELGDFPMIRRMLLGIKQRAEQHDRRGTRPEPVDRTIPRGAI
jgi:hypothetical protein